MSSTIAIDILKAAYRKIGVNDAEVDLTTFEINDGIDELNDMLLEWSARGIKLSFDPVQVQTDDTNLPDWALSAVKSNLGVRLISEFGSPVQSTLIEQARFGLKSILKKLFNNIETLYPSILPTGGEVSQYDNRRKFYPDFQQDDLFAETGQSINTESNRQIDIDGIEDALEGKI